MIKELQHHSSVNLVQGGFNIMLHSFDNYTVPCSVNVAPQGAAVVTINTGHLL